MSAIMSQHDALSQASHVATRLLQEGLQVEQIRILGRARPAVQVRVRHLPAHLKGSRYAWGCDRDGRFERYAALVDGVQVQWELRHIRRGRRRLPLPV
ncbi:MAG TPA: hypothetical protein VNN09_10050 [Candidatus Competibacteraceae bacterium]|nr:hypothetical protein [Candidatus Competibacteraceae bacterium]